MISLKRSVKSVTTSISPNNPSAQGQAAIPSGNIWQKTLIAIIVATILNLVLFAVGSLIGGLAAPWDPANPNTPMPILWSAVIIMTIAPMLIGTVVYWLLRRFIPGQATLVFIIGAALCTVVSLAPSIAGGEDMADKVILSVMHIVAGGSLIWFTTR
jgi:hypothetical protein